MQTIVVIVILLLLLIIVITFVGGQLGDMFGGLSDFGSGAVDELPEAGDLLGAGQEAEAGT